MSMGWSAIPMLTVILEETAMNHFLVLKQEINTANWEGKVHWVVVQVPALLTLSNMGALA